MQGVVSTSFHQSFLIYIKGDGMPVIGKCPIIRMLGSRFCTVYTIRVSSPVTESMMNP